MGNPHVQAVTGIGRVEAIGGHSTEGMQEESRKRYGNSARKGNAATSELALTRDVEAPVAAVWHRCTGRPRSVSTLARSVRASPRSADGGLLLGGVRYGK